MSKLKLTVDLRLGVSVVSLAALSVLATACGDDTVPATQTAFPVNPGDDTAGGDGDGTVDPGDPWGGGNGNGNELPGAVSNDPFCKVSAIVEAKCQSCHGASTLVGAPMSLVAHADYTVQAPLTSSLTVYEAIGQRIHDVQKPMPPIGLPALTEEEKATVDAWIAAGAPDAAEDCSAPVSGDGDAGDGDAGDGDGPVVGVWPPADCDEKFLVVSHAEGDKSKPMVVKKGSEVHPQVIWDAPWGSEDVQAVAFRTITDNTKVLHHWILYENTGSSLGAPFVTGWAPGNPEIQSMPTEVGMYLPKGTKSLRLDMHYNNLTGTQDEEDMSGVEVCVTRKKRANTSAVFMGFGNATSLSLPANKKTDILAYCKVSGSQPIEALSVSPHAHVLAYNMKMEVKRAADGAIEEWHNLPFAFEDQRIYPLNKTLQPGDVVKTTCSYNNTTSQQVTFGENTDDEMCFNFTTYYPMGGFSCDFLGSLVQNF